MAASGASVTMTFPLDSSQMRLAYSRVSSPARHCDYVCSSPAPPSTLRTISSHSRSFVSGIGQSGGLAFHARQALLFTHHFGVAAAKTSDPGGDIAGRVEAFGSGVQATSTAAIGSPKFPQQSLTSNKATPEGRSARREHLLSVRPHTPPAASSKTRHRSQVDIDSPSHGSMRRTRPGIRQRGRSSARRTSTRRCFCRFATDS